MLNTWLWSADDDEGVAQVHHLRRGADRLVERLRVGERPIGVAGVVGVVDAARFDVQEVALGAASR